ncbi:unnamed protein product [Tuber melanosporum]|uniref:(Perigord truffle) hypothetical protein n=1 Tax=Tuber melanosporum (strain Mel28) TaxID=656061 RepID=D5G424_TUBMM|nr:uncharacterized protein GSTUM_00003915001 [Tuber melanosporum]CAZ79267.1 unnamed protein product [Tuber melanosporum]
MSSNPEPDADAIRDKRLARLARLGGSSSPKPSAIPRDGETSMSQSVEQEKVAPRPQPLAPPITGLITGTPTSQLLDRPSGSTLEGVVTSPLSDTPLAETSLQTQPAAGNPSLGALMATEAWEDKALRQIFRVALEPGPRSAGLYVLDDLRKELEEQLDSEGKRPRIDVTILDQLILSVCARPEVVPMDYLVGSWRRASNMQRTMSASRMDDRKKNILQTAQRLCLNYGEYCISMPDIFNNDRAFVLLADRLQTDADEDRGLPQEFLNDLVSRLPDYPDLNQYFQETLRTLSGRLSEMSMTDNYKPLITALGRLMHHKPIIGILVDLPEFLPPPEDVPANLLEKKTILGPYFQISPLQTAVCKTYFTGAKAKSPTSINDATRALRLSLQTLQDQLYQIVMMIIRGSPVARAKMLDFFARVINLNLKRGAIQVDPTTVASDGFMLNINTVLTKLCEPFMDASFSKIDKIDIEYFRRQPGLDIHEETKINVDENQANEYYSRKVEGSNNFISEVFFLNVAAHHYGLGATETTHDQLAKDIGEMEKHLERFVAERQRWLNSPQLATWDRNIERMRERIDQGIAYKCALEVFLFDGLSQTRTLLFMRYLTTWLLRVVTPTHGYPEKLIKLPLPKEPPEQFSCLPEYFIEDIGLCFGFVGRYLPECIVTTQVDELVIFCITFLDMSTYIRKPSLKSKLVEILYYGISPYRGKSTGILGDVINSHPFALQNLMHALMNFYIEIERQYYERFTVRYHISEIIKSIWPNLAFREKLDRESKENVDFFVQFIALLLGDVTYVLHNSLSALADIHKLQLELENESSELTTQERADKEKALVKAERDATSYMSLGNETVAMLKLFTSAIADAFVKPEIVNTLAGMLNFNLEALVGPKCNNLRVRNPEKYKFNPKALLSEITDVYLNLRTFKPFVKAIALEGRSYRPELFTKLQSVLERSNLKGTPDIALLAKLAANIEETKRREEEGEVELGEIPDDFLDPLMATLMEDPVILPSSRVTIDRQTIRIHLLGNPLDPFNRSPLKVEDVISNTELKNQIQAWIKERRAKGTIKDDNGDEEAMDLDP